MDVCTLARPIDVTAFLASPVGVGLERVHRLLQSYWEPIRVVLRACRAKPYEVKSSHSRDGKVTKFRTMAASCIEGKFEKYVPLGQ